MIRRQELIIGATALMIIATVFYLRSPGFMLGATVMLGSPGFMLGATSLCWVRQVLCSVRRVYARFARFYARCDGLYHWKTKKLAVYGGFTCVNPQTEVI